MSAAAIVIWGDTELGGGIKAAIVSMLVETRWEAMEVIDSLWSNSTLFRDGAPNKPTRSRWTQPLSRRAFNCGRWIFSGSFIKSWAPSSEEERVRRSKLSKLAKYNKPSLCQTR